MIVVLMILAASAGGVGGFALGASHIRLATLHERLTALEEAVKAKL